MCDNVNNNPFFGLFSTVDDAVSFALQNCITDDHKVPSNGVQSEKQNEFKEQNSCTPQESEVLTYQRSNTLIENIFGLTLHEQRHAKKQLIFIDTDSIEHAVFERLMLSDPKSKLIPASKEISCDSHTIQTEIVPYLFESYCRLHNYKKQIPTLEDFSNLNHIILQNVSTALQEPELFQNQKIHQQFLSLFIGNSTISDELSSFVNGIVAELISENGDAAEEIVFTSFGPVLDIMHKEVQESTLLTFCQHWFTVLCQFASVDILAKLIIKHSTPKVKQGHAFTYTLLGAFLSLSCLPKPAEAQCDFFYKPLLQSHTAIEENIWVALDSLSESLHKVFHSLLKCSPEVRHLLLEWIGSCLYLNAQRGKLWNSHNDILGNMGALCVSDGFMLNLSSVLLRLCQPFYVQTNDVKVLKVDPTYCAAEAKNEEESRRRGMHLKGMTSETCLIPTADNETRVSAKSFGFVTECFFLTHRALDLGYRVILEKLMRTNQDLIRITRLYRETLATGGLEVMEVITQKVEMEMSKYHCLRASLLAPEMLKLITKFHATTAFWLMQVNLHDVSIQDTEEGDYSPKVYKIVKFPLPDTVPCTLRCIPEFVIENTVGFLCFLKRYNPNIFEEEGSKFLYPILTMIIAFMESQHRLYNPHLRARLAEGLEALLPTKDDVNDAFRLRTTNLGTFQRQQLFTKHPHREQIVKNLLQVFVSIEMTGQSVQFEQKFNYRRPMYVVMDYLWNLEHHRNNFLLLAQEAESNMESVQPPLFLRFINLLMNDAVFLLDEALTNMAQLRKMLQKRENGEWDNLPPHEREQQAGYLQHIEMIARFDNILGRETINTLKMLTTEIKSIFCHPTMVDRIASMLNYLLLQLVGPNKKNLKVKDQKEYDFNPAKLVLSVCEIYINLSENESFTLAVSQDGRSYSPQLFKLADDVLVRIGGGSILGDLDEFARKVEVVANQKKEEDEILSDAPEEFLDPIMSTIMLDPVILPSSRITIDRQTIARHLLSDQTDPFNRSALTMDMVEPHVDLRKKIQEWICAKKKERPTTSDCLM